MDEKEMFYETNIREANESINKTRKLTGLIGYGLTGFNIARLAINCYRDVNNIDIKYRYMKKNPNFFDSNNEKLYKDEKKEKGLSIANSIMKTVIQSAAGVALTEATKHFLTIDQVSYRDTNRVGKGFFEASLELCEKTNEDNTQNNE